MLRYQAKIACGLILCVVMPICFLLPVKMAAFVTKYGPRGQRFLGLMSCFAGGIFLSTYLVFMAPAVRNLIEDNLMKPYGIVYPLPDMLIGLGFFAMLALDKFVHFIDAKIRNKSNPDTDMNLNQREGSPSHHNLFQSGIMEITSTEVRKNRFTPSVTSLEHDGSVDKGDSNPAHRNQSTVDFGNSKSESYLRSIVMLLALSIDSILEGLTIGLKETVVEVWAIFIGIIVHESLISFCLGFQLVRVNPQNIYLVVAACVVYTLMVPIGILIATAIFETLENDPGMEIANGVLQALTSGCFIYIIFCEILVGQISHNSPLSKILAIFAGYASLSALAAIPETSHRNIEDICRKCIANTSHPTR